jgi:Txe/YoeB family toxin of toxin-antitoxin system
VFTKLAQRDAKKLKRSGLKEKAQELLDALRDAPFQNPPPYEKLVGDLAGAYSRRINIQHRLVYMILEEQRVVKVLRMWTHYE